MSRDLYVFDLDYTLIDADSSTLWCRYMVENHIAEDPDFLNKEKRLMDAYDRGELNVHDYIAFSMPPITKIPKEKVDAIVDDFVKNTFSNLIFKEAKELLNELKSQNESILLLSASADMIVNAVARYLGIKEAISVNIKVENGFYTDKIDGVPSFKEGKVICLEKYLLEHPEINGKITFYTDSINDLPLCLRADSVYTVNPGILLRQKALENNAFAHNLRRRRLEADYDVAQARGNLRSISLRASVGLTGQDDGLRRVYRSSGWGNNQVVEEARIRRPQLAQLALDLGLEGILNCEELVEALD